MREKADELEKVAQGEKEARAKKRARPENDTEPLENRLQLPGDDNHDEEEEQEEEVEEVEDIFVHVGNGDHRIDEGAPHKRHKPDVVSDDLI
jgi:hypothetical protein